MKNSYQWNEIPPFTMNTVKRISGRSKGYIADTGIICTSLAISTPEAISYHPSQGAIFETAVINEILKIASTIPGAPNFYHWRTHGGAEVDLIMERDCQYYPIEIKIKKTYLGLP